MIELLKELIAIESISLNEKAIADHVEKLLSSSNGSLSRIGNCVIWKNEWKKGREGIALGAHLDTVPFNEGKWQVTKPCAPLEKETKVYGRGSCDMKAGAAILIDLIQQKDLGDNYNFMVFFYDKEEIGFPNGVTIMLQEACFEGIDLCIIPEPTECKVIYGVLGNTGIKVKTRGLAVHSSDPKKGHNAIYELMPLIEKVKNLPLLKVRNTREAISVVKINGGNATNVIPEEAEAFIDYRIDPRKSKADIDAFFKGFENRWLSCEVFTYSPGVINSPEENPLIKSLVNRSEDGGIAPFWSDIGQLGAAGIPAVNFGPGSIDQAHTADEFVPVKDMKIIRKTLVDFLNS